MLYNLISLEMEHISTMKIEFKRKSCYEYSVYAKKFNILYAFSSFQRYEQFSCFISFFFFDILSILTPQNILN